MSRQSASSPSYPGLPGPHVMISRWPFLQVLTHPLGTHCHITTVDEKSASKGGHIGRPSPPMRGPSSSQLEHVVMQEPRGTSAPPGEDGLDFPQVLLFGLHHTVASTSS
ncbi:uncharacterized protein APUU_11891S [Aspergillus puulaauensis]|uniref:Uncharacterized protein n=1 Tax=Aspergillus puulaauensis TaxID=1220207 RepID=A0A7R7XD54_9EURO|nr:uncharacterized protein APUU_11891S [Aspergillus puulaauensis]BCS19063.1 hypothetical protein APUU_11891S [Aspergillus puulaauensis]